MSSSGSCPGWVGEGRGGRRRSRLEPRPPSKDLRGQPAQGAVRSHARPRAASLHHSDRGSQYASRDYREALSQQGFVVSMSRRGDCCDNAPVESFFATLKKELVAGEVFYTREQARREIVDYIQGFYNSWRRHSALGYLCPAVFEEKVA